MSFANIRQNRRRKSPPTGREIAALIARSYQAAQKLDTIGMAVVVTLDNGQDEHSKLTELPWTLGNGTWVAGVEGILGGFDCARIKPFHPPGKAGGLRTERGGA